MIKVFKLVRKYNNKYFSSNIDVSFANGKNKNLLLEYKIGEITRPVLKNTQIFTLSTPKSTDGVYPNRHFSLLACEAKPSKKSFCPSAQLFNWNKYIEYMNGGYVRFDHAGLSRLHPGTVFCDWVKPVEIIW